MITNTESRTPQKVNGPTNSSLLFYSTNRSEVGASTFQLYVVAAKSQRLDGEPEELTKARNDLISAYKVVIDFRGKGLVPIFPPHVYYALQVSGWLK
jgi:hypothetical protein